MKNKLVTANGTRVLTVEEYDRFINNIPKRMRSMFKISVIAGLKYVELQKLYENPLLYYKNNSQIILCIEDNEENKLQIRSISRLPSNFSDIFDDFINGKKPPYRSSWSKDLARWSMNTNITPKVGSMTPRRTIESWMLTLNFSVNQIYSRLGYDPSPIFKHCRTISFTDSEYSDIYNRLKLWEFIGESLDGTSYHVF
jgi:hypothetical protein